MTDPATFTADYRSFHRNRHRLTHRRGASVATSAIEAVDGVWESLLKRALDGGT